MYVFKSAWLVSARPSYTGLSREEDTMFTNKVLQIPRYEAGKSIEELMREKGLAPSKIIKMASNENPLGASPRVVQAIRRCCRNIYRYPDKTSTVLRQKLARQLKVLPDQLMIGNGSNEILECVIKSFVQPADEVIIATPTFPMYKLFSLMMGATVKQVPLTDFQQDVAAMKDAISPKTRIVFLSNPHNPAGTYISQSMLEKFLKSVPKEVIVVLDEAYYDFVTARDFPQSVPLIKAFPNIVIARTFSKAQGLAGLRVGYGVGSCAMIDLLNRFRQPFNVNVLAQTAACAVLDDRVYLEKSRALVRDAKKYFYKVLSQKGISYIPTEANFILIKVGKGKEVYEELLDQGIIVRPMDTHGLHEYIRVSFDTERHNQRFMRALLPLVKK